MPYKAIVTITTLLVIAGCSSVSKQLEPGALAPVRTIEIRDATDPVLLASTSARRVREYLEIGLKGRGYSVCRDCQSDAVATVTVSMYSTSDWIERGVLSSGGMQSVWTLSIVRNGETLFQRRMSHRKLMPIDQLAGQQVRDVLRQIPARQ
jgi:hypothetical protein